MEVFIRNIPPQTTEKSLKKYLQPKLDALHIKTFSCQKMGKFATVTFLHETDGHLFLSKYGQIDSGNGRRIKPPNSTQLYIMNVPIYCTASKEPLDKFQLRSLESEARAAESKQKHTIGSDGGQDNAPKAIRTFNFSSVSCGMWSYEGSELVFLSHQKWSSAGELRFGPKKLRLTMGILRIELPYSWIYNITVGGHATTSMALTCRYAPRFFESNESGFEALIRTLDLKIQTQRGSEKKKALWRRISALGREHQNIVSSCLVYRVDVASPDFSEDIRSLKVSREIPPTSYLRTRVHEPREPLANELRRLQQAFVTSYSNIPFPIMFQLQRLAQDGYLSPRSVIQLFPEIISMAKRSGTSITVSALLKLFHQVPYRGPEAEAYEFHYDTLVQKLRDNEERSQREGLYMGPPGGSDNVAIIYRAIVTPAGVYLHGPEPETKNRVLRKYSDHLDYFLRVQFCDEDGEQVRYDSRVSNDGIFYSRFKTVLQEGINIAGREYGFLGFSHSSLRSQTCWFMAPFVHEGNLQLYQMVIGNLGDFSHIQCPAKCAARIGQAFSDTPNTVKLGSIDVRAIPDVERNGRLFSDGVGTFSESVLEQIWDALPRKRIVKPTVFQIRYQGKFIVHTDRGPRYLCRRSVFLSLLFSLVIVEFFCHHQYSFAVRVLVVF
jgi:hypothetical protein